MVGGYPPQAPEPTTAAKRIRNAILAAIVSAAGLLVFFVGRQRSSLPDGAAVMDFEVMLDYFIEWNLKSADNEKSIVHCSAGIGRTGTTISLMNAIIAICAQKNAGVADP